MLLLSQQWNNAILQQPGQLPVISSTPISGVSCLPQFCQRWCGCFCGALQGTGASYSGKRGDGAIRPDWCWGTHLKAVAAGARGRWQRAAVPESFCYAGCTLPWGIHECLILRQSALLRGGSEGCVVVLSSADSLWIPVEQNTRERNKISIWKTFCPALCWFSEAAFHCMPRRSHSIRKCGSSRTLFKVVHKRLFYFLGP